MKLIFIAIIIVLCPYKVLSQHYHEDFENDIGKPPWNKEGHNEDVSSKNSLSGNFSFRAYLPAVQYTKTTGGNDARSEIRWTGGGTGTPNHQPNGTTWGIKLAIFFPEDFKPDNASPESLFQYHSVRDEGDTYSSPPIMARLKGSSISITNRWISKKIASNADQHVNTWNTGKNVVPGKWHYFVVDIHWDYSETGNGFLKVYMNIGSPPDKGDLVLNYKGPTGYNDDKGSYFKMGIYKWAWTVKENVEASKAEGVIHRLRYYDDFEIKEGGFFEGASSNLAPTADAGPDQSLILPENQITLNGSASDADGTIASYLWSQLSGPNSANMAGKNNPKVDISGLEAGSYVFRLLATDNNGATDHDDVTIAVESAPNQAPIVDAGPNQTIILPTDQVTFNGSATDSDGTITSYRWTQEAGPTIAVLSGEDSPTLNASELIEGIYRFRLTVTDNNGDTSYDDARVTIEPAPNQAPSADAGANQTIILPNDQVTLNGNASDVDGTVASYLWTQQSGPQNATLNGEDSSTLEAVGLIEGIYSFRLTVTDDNGATGFDEVTVTVEPAPNQAPTVDAGANQTIILPTDQVTFNGSASDVDGSVSSYQWTQEAGPTNAVLSGEDSPTLKATGLIEGTYRFRLTVTDNNGATGNDDVRVIVEASSNQAPSADAGANQTIILPNDQVTFNGNASDVDGTVDSYLWTQQSGPTTATLNGENSPTLEANGLIEGTYSFRLTVTDNSGATGFDEVTVTVEPAPNQAPTVDAGPNHTIMLPTNQVILYGSALDVDGTVSSYLWTQESGPTNANLNGNNSPTLEAEGLIEGTYSFRLTATDNNDATGYDEVTVHVEPANLQPVPNQAPSVDAGNNQTIVLPINQVTFNGTVTDVDGTISAYLWTQLSGPTNAALNGVDSPTLEADGLIEGTYSFQLQATDNDGATEEDEVTVTVEPAPNQAPSADAGANQTIVLPTNQVNFNGTATDVDGTIDSFLWTQLSGPSNATLSGENSPALQASGLIEGTYRFQMEVVDNDGAIDDDEVTVTVEPALNQAPSADAGANQIIVLPVNQVTLNGTAVDVDGTLSSYSWAQLSGPNDATLSGEDSPTLEASGLVEGTYSFRLTVTDNNGATDDDDVAITVEPAPNQAPSANAGSNQTIVLPANQVIFNGSATDNDGTISSYHWTQLSGPSNATLSGENSPTLQASGLIEGTYSFQFTVTDDDGATDNAEVIAMVLAAPITVSATISHATCDADNGAIALSITGGTEPFQFTWSNGAATKDIGNLLPGTYQVTIIDGNGATLVNSFNVDSEESEIFITTKIKGASCDTSDGAVSVSINGGVGPYTLEWSNGEKKSTIRQMPAGQYQLKITDKNGCSNEFTIEVPVEPGETDMELISEVVAESCVGNDGSISLEVLGDHGPYTYNWSNGMKGPDLSGLGIGVYQVVITDNHGCFSKHQYTINQASLPLPIIIQSGDSLYLNQEAENYQWYKEGLVIDGATQNSLKITETGNYMVQISDGNCSEISEPHDVLEIYTTSNTGITIEQIDVYPNPVSKFLNLKIFLNETAETGIAIYDSQGIIIWNQNLGAITSESTKIDVSNYPPGIYYIKISSGFETVTRKFVKR